jgi:hypothetical protein
VAINRQNLLFQKPEEIDQLVALRMWSGRTRDGSRSDLDFRPLPSVWEAVQSEDDNCLGRSCPHHGECFFYQARRRLKTANVLVVNHALFVTDLALKGDGFGILPDYQVAVIDEAHPTGSFVPRPARGRAGPLPSAVVARQRFTAPPAPSCAVHRPATSRARTWCSTAAHSPGCCRPAGQRLTDRG